MTCEKYLAAVPWPQFAVAVLIGFLVGGALGIVVGRRHPAPPRKPREPKGSAMKKWNSLSLGQEWLDRHPRLAAAYARVAPILVVVALVASVWASIGTWQNSRDTASLAKANQAALIAGCLNANESRAATLAVWTFLFNVSIQSNPAMTGAQRANIASMQEWIGKIYAPHDCTDLDRKYPLPDPPIIKPPAP